MIKNRKKGFTLVELLAVLVILSLIALISVPIILSLVDDTEEQAHMECVHSLVSSAKLYYAQNVFNEPSINFDDNGEINILDNLEVSGRKPDSGYVKINNKGDVKVAAIYDEICFFKNYEDSDVRKADNITECEDYNSKYIIDYIKENEDVELTPNYLGKYDYRIYGASVENYVYFNDDVWRIIGIVNDNIKLVKQTSIGYLPWNSRGNNNWDNSTLKEYLNGTYYNSIKPEYQAMIQEARYNIGGVNNTDIPGDQIYDMENSGDNIPSSKIAIMYPSDYIYSMSKDCKSTPSNYGNDDDCKADGTWLYSNGMQEWLLAGHPDNNNTAANVVSGGFFFFYYSGYVSNSYNVRPVLYLKSNVVFVEGDGTKDSPFTLELQ